MDGRNRPRIAWAMEDLKSARDNGQDVHPLVDEVAETHEVSADELRRRAELSWGAPLETDRVRNAAHFAALEVEKSRQAAITRRELEVRHAAVSDAEKCYSDNLLNEPARAGDPLWGIVMENLIRRLRIDDKHLVQLARETVRATVEQLDRNNGTSTKVTFEIK